MSDELFREVDEDLRKERYQKLWNAYGKYVVGAVVAIVAITAGTVGWREYQTSQRIEHGARFAAAQKLVADGNLQQGADAFAALAESAGAGYSALALLQEAAARARDGDRTAAVVVYDRVAADDGFDPRLRDVARLLAVLQLVNSAEATDLVDRLSALTAADNPFRHSARELNALIRVKSGDTAAAKKSYAELSDDATAPPGVRARAAEMLAALGGVD